MIVKQVIKNDDDGVYLSGSPNFVVDDPLAVNNHRGGWNCANRAVVVHRAIAVDLAVIGVFVKDGGVPHCRAHGDAGYHIQEASHPVFLFEEQLIAEDIGSFFPAVEVHSGLKWGYPVDVQDRVLVAHDASIDGGLNFISIVEENGEGKPVFSSEANVIVLTIIDPPVVIGDRSAVERNQKEKDYKNLMCHG